MSTVDVIFNYGSVQTRVIGKRELSHEMFYIQQQLIYHLIKLNMI